MGYVMRHVVKEACLFLLILALFSLLPLLGFQYYEGNTDPGIVTYFNSIITSKPHALPNVNGNWKLISHLFAELYKVFPHFDWYGFTMILFGSFAAFTFLKILRIHWERLSSSQFGLGQKVILSGIFLLFLENILILEFTRMAYVLSFTGFLMIIYPFFNNPSNVSTNYLMGWGWLAILLGGLVRTSPAILSFIVIIPLLCFFWWKNKIPLALVAKTFSLPILFVILLIALSDIKWNQMDRYTVSYAGYLINVWDVGQKDDLQLSSRGDSLTYQVTMMHFMNDFENINPAFFEKIGVPYTRKKINNLPNLIFNDVRVLKKIREEGLHFLERHIGWTIFFVIITIIALWSNFEHGYEWLYIVAVFIGFLLIYFMIAIFMKMADRIISPMFFSFSTILAFLIPNFEKPSQDTKPSFLSLLIVCSVLSVVSIEASFSGDLVANRKRKVHYHNQFLNKLSSLDKQYQFVGYISSWFYSKPFQQPHTNPKVTYLSIDNQGFCFVPTYWERMKQVTGGESVEEYWQFMKDHSEETIIVSEKERIEKLVQYFNYQYNVEMKVEPIISDFRKHYNGKARDVKPVGIFKIM